MGEIAYNCSITRLRILPDEEVVVIPLGQSEFHDDKTTGFYPTDFPIFGTLGEVGNLITSDGEYEIYRNEVPHHFICRVSTYQLLVDSYQLESQIGTNRRDEAFDKMIALVRDGVIPDSFDGFHWTDKEAKKQLSMDAIHFGEYFGHVNGGINLDKGGSYHWLDKLRKSEDVVTDLHRLYNELTKPFMHMFYESFDITPAQSACDVYNYEFIKTIMDHMSELIIEIEKKVDE